MSQENNYIDKLFDLQNKVVLITGGGGVLAGAIGEGFANAGALVILAGIRIENTEENARRISSAFSTELI